MTGVDVRPSPQEPTAAFAVFSFMRVREENCNMVLLGAVTLFSTIVAIVAGVWQGPQSTAAEASPKASPSDKPPIYLAADRTLVPPVRVVGAPFVPNLNPRDR
jgi:hypothetical protein